jgi:hypothetical protein
MILAVPGGKGLFSVLHQVIKVRSECGRRLRLTAEVHTILKDFGNLATDLRERPTRRAELIPSTIPATSGAQDATGPGMGGVHVSLCPTALSNLYFGAPPFRSTCSVRLSPLTTL